MWERPKKPQPETSPIPPSVSTELPTYDGQTQTQTDTDGHGAIDSARANMAIRG